MGGPGGHPPLYIPQDGLYVPCEPVMSPWDHALQSGIAQAALLTRAIEAAPEPGPMVLARLTIDIMRKVPFAPIAVRTEVIRDGRQMQNVDAFIEHEGVVVARATALKIRAAETEAFPMEGPLAPPPEEAPERAFDRPDGIRGPLETRIIQGGFDGGPGLVWARPRVEIIPGEAISPTAGAAMAADLAGGISAVLSRKRWVFSNVDLSLNFSRSPVSDWILISSSSSTDGNGVGQAMATLSDRTGAFGTARQTQFVAPRPSRRAAP